LKEKNREDKNFKVGIFGFFQLMRQLMIL